MKPYSLTLFSVTRMINKQSLSVYYKTVYTDEYGDKHSINRYQLNNAFDESSFYIPLEQTVEYDEFDNMITTDILI